MLLSCVGVPGGEGLILCYPATPYVCLGLHDDLDQELDTEYCKQKGIPVLRRETGGGPVYLDRNQIFFQLVLNRSNPLLPLRRVHFFETFLRPAISVYRSLGVPAALRPPADLTAEGRKCSGSAAGDIGPGVAYVGNIMVDFDFQTMSEVLRVPTPAFRRSLYVSLRRYMTTLDDWRSEIPENSRLISHLANEFCRVFGSLTPRTLDRELIDRAALIRDNLTSPEWLNLPGRRYDQRRVKIAEGICLVEEKSVEPHGAVVFRNADSLEENSGEPRAEENPCRWGPQGNSPEAWGADF